MICLFGWGAAVIFFSVSIVILHDKNRIQSQLNKAKAENKNQIYQQMVELRQICHNINTPINSMSMALDALKHKNKSNLSEDKISMIDDACDALEDLYENVKDIKQYCDERAQNVQISIKDIHDLTQKEINDPYVINS